MQCFAPDRDQMHVVNHMNGEEQSNARNVLQESARIARGNVKTLDQLKAADFDALFIPGGFGAAKNLSDFGVNGANMAVKDDVTAVLKEFHAAQKYIGLCCIAPILAAKVFGSNSGGEGAKITLGSKGSEEDWPYQGSIDAATSFGNDMVEADIDAVVHDEKNKIVTAPAYMKGTATPAQISDNVKKMVDTVADQLREQKISERPFAILVHVQIKADRIDDFKKVMTVNSENSRLEPGCLRFDTLEDAEDPCKFTFYEVYKNLAALDDHKKT